ncbi:MAG TPA: nucleotide disphospho-sugar-binding domain-containing protein [Microlunatus sp.]
MPFERTVYLTLGTIMNNTAGVMETALRGALGCEANFVATTGPHGGPRRFGDLPPHVLVRAHITQATVLAHCSAVISHAGAGTILAALSLGLPQLTLPIGCRSAVQRSDTGTRRGWATDRTGRSIGNKGTERSPATARRDSIHHLGAALAGRDRRHATGFAVLRAIEQRLMASNDRDRVPRDVSQGPAVSLSTRHDNEVT